MKAAQITSYGDAGVVNIVDIEKPAVGKDQVLIEVHAASLNPWDSKVRSGAVKESTPLNLPITLGGDMAGVIVAVGEGVKDFELGDKVYGGAGVPGGSGAFAEYAVAKTAQIAKIPDAVDFVVAAAAALTGVSAIQALKEHMNLQAGQKILIHGGAGGIGSLAIQLAKHIGAYVVTTADTKDLEFVRTLGADEVIDYTAQKFEEAVSECDSVFDTVGGDTFERSFAVLKKGGIIVSMISHDDKGLAENHSVTAISQFTHATTDKLEQLVQLIADGVLTVHVDKTFPLDQIQEAFRARESGSIRGKIAITIK